MHSHGGPNAQSTRFIVGGQNNAEATVGVSGYGRRQTVQMPITGHLAGDEKSIHINEKDNRRHAIYILPERGLLKILHHPATKPI
jgi:hypothetical protein